VENTAGKIVNKITSTIQMDTIKVITIKEIINNPKELFILIVKMLH
jgi:hypothetical protein